jgi:hypothetical protein
MVTWDPGVSEGIATKSFINVPGGWAGLKVLLLFRPLFFSKENNVI